MGQSAHLEREITNKNAANDELASSGPGMNKVNAELRRPESM